MNSTQDFDAIVIGAGIAGASVACFLAPQARVAIVEREAQPGYHSTGRSAAVFAPSYGPPQVRSLTRASRRYLHAVPGVLSPRGSLFPARASQVQALHALRERLVAEGAVGVALLDTRAAQALVPVLRNEAVAAALRDDDASDIDVQALHQHYLRSAKAARAQAVCDFDVSRLEFTQQRWEVGSAAGTLRAPIIVNGLPAANSRAVMTGRSSFSSPSAAAVPSDSSDPKRCSRSKPCSPSTMPTNRPDSMMITSDRAPALCTCSMTSPKRNSARGVSEASLAPNSA